MDLPMDVLGGIVWLTIPIGLALGFFGVIVQYRAVAGADDE